MVNEFKKTYQYLLTKIRLCMLVFIPLIFITGKSLEKDTVESLINELLEHNNILKDKIKENKNLLDITLGDIEDSFMRYEWEKFLNSILNYNPEDSDGKLQIEFKHSSFYGKKRTVINKFKISLLDYINNSSNLKTSYRKLLESYTNLNNSVEDKNRALIYKIYYGIDYDFLIRFGLAAGVPTQSNENYFNIPNRKNNVDIIDSLLPEFLINTDDNINLSDNDEKFIGEVWNKLINLYIKRKKYTPEEVAKELGNIDKAMRQNSKFNGGCYHPYNFYQFMLGLKDEKSKELIKEELDDIIVDLYSNDDNSFLEKNKTQYNIEIYNLNPNFIIEIYRQFYLQPHKFLYGKIPSLKINKIDEIDSLIKELRMEGNSGILQLDKEIDFKNTQWDPLLKLIHDRDDFEKYNPMSFKSALDEIEGIVINKGGIENISMAKATFDFLMFLCNNTFYNENCRGFEKIVKYTPNDKEKQIYNISNNLLAKLQKKVCPKPKESVLVNEISNEEKSEGKKRVKKEKKAPEIILNGVSFHNKESNEARFDIPIEIRFYIYSKTNIDNLRIEYTPKSEYINTINNKEMPMKIKKNVNYKIKDYNFTIQDHENPDKFCFHTIIKSEEQSLLDTILCLKIGNTIF